MALATISSARDFIEVVVGAVSVLGGSMAIFSGLEASSAIRDGRPAEEVAACINEGLAAGFELGLWLAAFAFTILALS